MIFVIYMILLILQPYKGIATVVPDPCPSKIKNSKIVADMCKSSFAMENIQHSGNHIVDSVVLRIMTQDNCICRVTIDNQIQTVSTALRKYGGLTSSAPAEYGCGLAVDINHLPDMSTGPVIAPIECIDNVDFRNIILFQNSSLQFKSRIINGNFTRGYCMRINRDISSNHSQVIRISCDAPMTTEQTTHHTINSDPTTDSSGNVEYSSITTTSSSHMTDSMKSSTLRTTGDTTITTPTTNTSNRVVSPSMTTDATTGIEQTTYIAIGAGSSVALILLVVLVVILLRRKSTQKEETNGDVNNSHQQEESDDKLQDNVLYIPAEEFNINGGNYSTADMDTARSSNKILSVEGNYSTVDEDIPTIAYNRISMAEDYSTVELDEHLNANCSYPANSELRQTKGKQKPTIKPKPKAPGINSEENRSSDPNKQHITPPNGGDNVYAVVDKSNKNVPTANVCKVEATCQPDQTYAVVDKARKRKSNPDETNKKKFEINSGN